MVIGNLWVVWDAFVTGVHTVTKRISFLPTKPGKIADKIAYGLGVAVFGSILIGLTLTVQTMQIILAGMLIVALAGSVVVSRIPKEV